MGLIEFVKEDEGSESTDFEYDSDQKKRGVLYKVIKCLFVVCAIVLSTLFLSSINSPKTGHLLSLQGYIMVQDFALGNVSLNQSLEREPSFRGATESGYLKKSRTVFDKIHLPDEGEINLLQVYVSENVVEQVLLEDSTEHRAVTAVNMFDAIEASNMQLSSSGDTDSSGESAKIEAFSYKINEQRKCDVLSTCEVDKSVRGFGEAIVTDVVLAMGALQHSSEALHCLPKLWDLLGDCLQNLLTGFLHQLFRNVLNQLLWRTVQTYCLPREMRALKKRGNLPWNEDSWNCTNFERQW